MNKIGMVFTNYNNTQFTSQLLDSLYTYIENIDVVIVDNFSNIQNRKDLKKLEAKYKKVNFIYLKYNIGYFQGLNFGLNFLRTKNINYEYFIIGNNDLIFNSRLLTDHNKIKALCEHKLIIAPSIMDKDGNFQNPHVFKSISNIRLAVYDLFYSNYFLAKLLSIVKKPLGAIFARDDESNYNFEGDIEQGFGACYIVSNLFYEYFDMLFAPVFLMHEEYFLTYQLRSKGHKVHYSKVLDINHIGKSSTGKVPSKKLYQISKASHLTTKFFEE